jgi:hypothetical protein
VVGVKFIREYDASWTFPADIWANQKGLASNIQNVNMKLMKYIINPFDYEVESGAFTEANMTKIEFLTLGVSEIPVILTSSTYVEFRDPY